MPKRYRLLSQSFTVQAAYEPVNGRLELRKWRSVVAGVAGRWQMVESLDGPPIAGFDRVITPKKRAKE